MKHIKTFESFIYESATGEGYLQISFTITAMIGGHSISCAVTSQDEHMGELSVGASSELETSKVKQLLRELQTWKQGDKSGKIGLYFLELVDKNMMNMGFRLGKYISKLKPPYVMVVKDESQLEKALTDVIAILNKTYDSYTPSLFPDQGKAASMKGLVGKLINNFEGGRSDYERDLAAFVIGAVGANTQFYLEDYYDNNEPLIKVNEEYTKNGKVDKDYELDVIKATSYTDGVVIIRTGKTAKKLSLGLKPGNALFAAKKP